MKKSKTASLYRLAPFKNVRKIVLVMQMNVEIIKTNHHIKRFNHKLLVTINQRVTVSIRGGLRTTQKHKNESLDGRAHGRRGMKRWEIWSGARSAPRWGDA